MLNILLQILDDGHITDAQGRNVNFENNGYCHDLPTRAAMPASASSVGFSRTADQQGRERAMKALESFPAARVHQPRGQDRLLQQAPPGNSVNGIAGPRAASGGAGSLDNPHGKSP